MQINLPDNLTDNLTDEQQHIVSMAIDTLIQYGATMVLEKNAKQGLYDRFVTWYYMIVRSVFN